MSKESEIEFKLPFKPETRGRKKKSQTLVLYRRIPWEQFDHVSKMVDDYLSSVRQSNNDQ